MGGLPFCRQFLIVTACRLNVLDRASFGNVWVPRGDRNLAFGGMPLRRLAAWDHTFLKLILAACRFYGTCFLVAGCRFKHVDEANSKTSAGIAALLFFDLANRGEL
jgi:hypothetical protein